MNRILRISSGFFLLLLFLTGCKKDIKIYDRPGNLAQPIYQQLVARKNFTSFLACVDKAGYKNILNTTGYWTIFAPNDSAFIKYFTENGINGIGSLDSISARKIVAYSMVYNAFRKDQLTNYQSSVVIPNQSFKKKTAFYDFVQTENGTTRKIIASNRNGSYVVGDNNNKSIPFFMDNFLNSKGLITDDYNAFYPNSKYTGFNVVDASVVNADIVAENGIIHEINRVVLPLPNIEQYIASNSDYSEFRNLLNKVVTYSFNSDITHRYHVYTGSTDTVYNKFYNSSLRFGTSSTLYTSTVLPVVGFSPNNESYLLGTTDSQIDGYTLLAPTNKELLAYTRNLLMYYGGSFDNAPPDILVNFINAHMWTNNVWKSKFATSLNVQGEVPTISYGNVVNAKLLSNGIFYGTNKVQDANVFRTVYSKPYLNPKYLYMTLLLNAELKYSIISPIVKFTMFMMSDASLKAAGYDYSYIREPNPWGYANPGPPPGAMSYGTGPRDQLYRILQTSILKPNINLTDISGEGIVEGYNGEYVKYKNNTAWASGNFDAGNYLVKDSSLTVVNGTVYYTHEVVPTGKQSTGGLLTYTTKSIGAHINALALADPTNFGSFNSFLIKSKVWDAANLAILGTSNGTFYTIFIPNNTAISNAVKQGFLPATGLAANGVPNFSPVAGSADEAKVTKFLQYHLINGTTVVPDGVKNGAFPTIYTNGNGDKTYITVYNQLNNMYLVDENNNRANVVLSKSNNLSNRTVIHSIDNFLMFKQ